MAGGAPAARGLIGLQMPGSPIGNAAGSAHDPSACAVLPVDAIAEVVALETLRCALLNAGDLAALALLLDDAYLHVHANGTVTDKPTTLARMGTQPRQTERRTLTVQVWGDAGLIVGEQVNRSRQPDGTEQITRGTVTQTLRRRDGSWVFLSSQFTGLPS